MNKVLIFLSNNNIPFSSFMNGKDYVIAVSKANEIQTNDLINLAEAEGLVYKLSDGMQIYEPIKEITAKKSNTKK